MLGTFKSQAGTSAQSAMKVVKSGVSTAQSKIQQKMAERKQSSNYYQEEEDMEVHMPEDDNEFAIIDDQERVSEGKKQFKPISLETDNPY
jgi:hypothetical protein